MTYQEARTKIEKAAGSGEADHRTVQAAKDTTLAHILKAVYRL